MASGIDVVPLYCCDQCEGKSFISCKLLHHNLHNCICIHYKSAVFSALLLYMQLGLGLNKNDRRHQQIMSSNIFGLFFCEQKRYNFTATLFASLGTS